MNKNRSPEIMASKWFMPVSSFGLGLVVFAVSWLGGSLVSGLVSLAILTAFGLLLTLLGERSETVRGLTTRRDERFAQIDLYATAVAGMAVVGAVIVAFLVQTARGHNPQPYDWLGAIGGIAYLVAVAFFRWRG